MQRFTGRVLRAWRASRFNVASVPIRFGHFVARAVKSTTYYCTTMVLLEKDEVVVVDPFFPTDVLLASGHFLHPKPLRWSLLVSSETSSFAKASGDVSHQPPIGRQIGPLRHSPLKVTANELSTLRLRQSRFERSFEPL